MPTKKVANREPLSADMDRDNTHRDQDFRPDSRASAQEQSETAKSEHRPLAVLIVDDYPGAAELIAVFLKTKGYDVRAATSGADALALLDDDWHPDVALLDLLMPGMDGFELAGRLSEGPKPRPILIAITGVGHLPARERTLAAGFERHLLKPVNPSALAKLLKYFADNRN